MYVCICSAVTEAQVRLCIAGGASTVEDVGAGCAAGTGCGSCLERIEAMLGLPGGDSWNRLPRSA
ncbi:MAG TPA: (2Fe-2S)-binding protein [Pseudonocardiaceae bacterium]